MADEKTHNDSIRCYLTGATSDGGSQANPNASLGNYRSSTEVQELAAAVTNPITGITINFVSGANGPGAGTLTASGASELKWAPPEGSQGSGVTIVNGETKVLEAGGGATEKYVRVTRSTPNGLSGEATVTLTEVKNNLIGFDNVSTWELTNGDTEYRALMVKNEAASQIKSLAVWLSRLGTARTVNASGYAASGAIVITCKTDNFNDWPATGFVENENRGEVIYYSERTSTALTCPATGRNVWGEGGSAGYEDDVIVPIPGVRIAKEAPFAQTPPSAYIQTIANEGTAPTGLSWVHPHADNDPTVLSIGDLDAGNVYGLWLARRIPTSCAVVSDPVNQRIEWTFDAAA